MKIQKNENTIDRLIRMILASIFFILAFYWSYGVLQIILYTLSLVMLVTAISGFCALYKILNINTIKETNTPTLKIIPIPLTVIFFVIIVVGSYFSNFFTKKFFIEDYNKMNQYYKQTLFYTGQDKRVEALDNYNKLVVEYSIFESKYIKYHPYAISKDKEFNNDLIKVSDLIINLKDKVNTGDLKSAHTDFEQVRPIFQDILKRNNFSMLAITLVDFHDAMEKIIATSDAKDVSGTIAIYEEVSNKLKAIEEVVNDNEIQSIRGKLDELLVLAQNDKSLELSSKAAELKSAFVKVYLKRG